MKDDACFLLSYQVMRIVNTKSKEKRGYSTRDKQRKKEKSLMTCLVVPN